MGDGDLDAVLPPGVVNIAGKLDCFIVENSRSARRYLTRLPLRRPIQEIEFFELSEHTQAASLPALLAPLLAGQDVGLLSEAGCPAVADPGAALVRLAHEQGVPVEPLVGPSSLLLALMASGLEGQRFAFQGYLPAKTEERQAAIATLENRSSLQRETQLFIETPYRNDALLADVLAACRPDTRLSLAVDLTAEGGWNLTRTIASWREAQPVIGKKPAVFGLLAAPPPTPKRHRP